MMVAANVILIGIIIYLLLVVGSLNRRIAMLEMVVDNMGLPLNALLKVHGMIADMHSQDWSDSEPPGPEDVLMVEGKEHKHVS